MTKTFIAVGLAIYLLLLLFIFVDLTYVYQYYSIHPAQAIPLALGVELLAAYFSAVAIYYRNRLLKSVAVLFALFVWFLVMTASTKLWTQITVLSIAVTLFVPFGNLVLPSIIAYLLQLHEKTKADKQAADGLSQQKQVGKSEDVVEQTQLQIPFNSEAKNETRQDSSIPGKHSKQKRTNANIAYNVVGPIDLIRLIESDTTLRAYIDLLSKYVLKKVSAFEIKDGNIVDANGNQIRIRRNLLKKGLLKQLNGIKVQKVAS